MTINEFSVMEQYPIPSLEELLSKFSGGTRFTKIDLFISGVPSTRAYT